MSATLNVTVVLDPTLNVEVALAGVQGPAGAGAGVSDGDKGDIVVSGSGTVWTIDSGVLTTAGRALIDDASATAQRATLGLGTAATAATGDFEASGTIATHAALTSSVHGIGTFGASLVDDADAPAARATLGLGTAATAATGDFAAAAHTHDEDDLTLSDVTTGNASTTKHGFAPKLPNNAAQYYDGTGAFSTPGGGSGTVLPAINGFRLTGVTGAPVMTSDSTSLSTIYCTPFRGATIALYTGSAWEYLASGEVSLAVTGRTTDLPFDIFGYNNGGTLTLEFTDWTNATTRATAITRQDGIWCKSGSLTRRYLGTCRPRSATTFHWVRAGDDAPCKFDLWNADNRVVCDFTLRDTSTSHNYTVATWRQWSNSANFQIDVVAGLQEEAFVGTICALHANTSGGGTERYTAFGFDSTTAITGLCGENGFGGGVLSLSTIPLRHTPGIGRHFYAWLQYSAATSTTTWYGDNNTPLRLQSGITGVWAC